MTASVQTIALAGARYVILPEADYRNLTAESGEPPRGLLPYPGIGARDYAYFIFNRQTSPNHPTRRRL